METSQYQALSQTERLWSPRQIGVAAFLGSPLAAGWFFSRNYLAFGEEAGARRVLWLGLAATAAVLATAFFLPRNFPNAVLPAAYAFAIERYASSCFGTAYEKHVALDGAKGSWWTVVTIGLLSCVLLIALAVIVLYTLAWWTGTQIDWNPRH